MATAEIDLVSECDRLREEVETLKAQVAKLEKAAKERPDIERAKELLMFAFRLDGSTCHNLIKRTATRNHVSLFVISQWIIEQMKSGDKIVIQREWLSYSPAKAQDKNN